MSTRVDLVQPGSAARPQPRRGINPLLLSAALLAQFAAASLQQGLAVLAGQIRDLTGASTQELAMILAATNLGIFASVFAWALVAERQGSLRTTWRGLTLCAATLLTAAVVVPAPELLAALLLLAGIGSAAPIASAGKTTILALGENRVGLAMGLRQMTIPAAAALAAAALPRITGRWNLHGALIALGTVAAVAVAVSVAASTGYRPPPLRGRMPPFSRGMRRLLAASAFFPAIHWAFLLYLPLFLQDTRTWTAVEAGDLLFVVLLLSAATRVALGLVSDRRPQSDRWVALVIGCAPLGVTGVALAARGSGALVVALSVAAVIASAWGGVAHSLATRRVTEVWINRAHGALNTVLYAGGALWAPIILSVATNYGWERAWLVAGIAGVVGGILALGARD